MINKADIYLKNTISKILEEGVVDENPRPKYLDNTPAHSKFITQQVFNFDISKGEFPISTLRNGSLKLAFQEMKTIFITQSNKDEDFMKNEVNWWSPWMNKDGNLGTAYSYNLESMYEDSYTQLYKVDKKIGTDSPLQEDSTFKELSTNQSHVLANKIMEGKFVKYKILNKTSKNRYNIQLLDCGLVKEVCRSTIQHNAVVSPYSKLLGGEFYYGIYNHHNFTESDFSVILSMWRNIGDRITGKGSNNRKYSLNNIDKRWLCFANFLEDIPYIPQFFLAKRDGFKGWVLDKDYYGSSFYSKNTCVFIKNKDNLKYRDTQKIYKSGEFITDSTQALAEYLDVSCRSIRYIY